MYFSKRNSSFTIVLLLTFLVAMFFVTVGCLDSATTTEETFTYYRDADGDGFGDSNDSIEEADQPDGYVENDDDCDDTDAAINPALMKYAMTIRTTIATAALMKSAIR